MFSCVIQDDAIVIIYQPSRVFFTKVLAVMFVTLPMCVMSSQVAGNPLHPNLQTLTRIRKEFVSHLHQRHINTFQCWYPHPDLLHHFLMLITFAFQKMHCKAPAVDLLDCLPCDTISMAKPFCNLFSLLGRSPVFLVPFLRTHTVVMVKPLRYKQIEFFPRATSSNMLFIISFWVILTLLWMFSIFLSVESCRFGRSSRKGWKCF